MKQHHFDSALMGGAPNSVQTIDAMLQPDTILPSQFYGSRRHDDRVRGERALWREVLMNARRCLDSDPDSIVYKDAVVWFEDVDNEAVASLTWCCDAIGADPHGVSRYELARAERGEKLARTSRMDRVGQSSAARIGSRHTRDRQAEARRRIAKIAAEHQELSHE